MEDKFFDIAFEEFYTRWVLRKSVTIRECHAFYNSLNINIDSQDFIRFLEKLKNNEMLKKEFDSFYNKDVVKSFTTFLYNKVNKNTNVRNNENEYIELVWLVSFFQKLIDEFFLDAKVEIDRFILKETENLVYLKKDFNKVLEKYEIKNINIETKIKETVDVIEKAKKMQKCDFVLNGKYNNNELYALLMNPSLIYYKSTLPCFERENSIKYLNLNDFFNYPLSDNMLFLEFIYIMSFEYSKKHLSEYYVLNGDDRIKDKYKRQKEKLFDILINIEEKGIETVIGFEYLKDVNINEEIEDLYSLYLSKLGSIVLGVGCIFDTEDVSNNPLYPLFYQEYERVRVMKEQKNHTELANRIKKNPMFFKKLFFKGKVSQNASSLKAVLSDNSYLSDKEQEKRFYQYEKEVDEYMNTLINRS